MIFVEKAMVFDLLPAFENGLLEAESRGSAAGAAIPGSK